MSTEPIEELRERVTEILGEPNEAVVDALLVYATNRIARVAGGEMAARWRIEDDVKALLAQWEQGVVNLHAANEEERHAPAARERAMRAAEIERCARELRDTLSAPHSSAEPVSPASTPTGATGGAGEAQEGSDG